MSPNVDWSDLVQKLLPEWWRKLRLWALLHVLISPVRELHTTFLALRDRTLYDMRLNGQTMYLEKALNDRFDDDDRGIYIETVEDPTQLYIYRKAEDADPLYIYRRWSGAEFYFVGARAIHAGGIWVAVNAHSGSEPNESNANWSYLRAYDTFIRRKGESLQGVDFIIYVPLLLVYDEYELRALVERYRQAGKRYIILTY